MAINSERCSKFNPQVLKEVDDNGDLISTWCIAGSAPDKAICTFCNVTINCKHHGSAAVKRHAKNATHIAGCNKRRNKDGILLAATQRRIDLSKPGIITSFSHNDKVLSSEIQFVVSLAVNNVPYAFSDAASIVLPQMFSDSQIAKDFKCSRIKTSYLISDGIGPYLREQLLKEIRDSAVFFSITVDETPLPEKRYQQMDVLIRFYSEKCEQVTVQHLQSFHIGHATAEDLFNCLSEVLEELPRLNLLCFFSDGPNVMKSLKKKVLTLNPQLLDISTCSLHKVHNCFSKALNVFGGDVETFLIDLYYYFKHSAAKSEDLRTLQSQMGFEAEKVLLRHVNSRWLTLQCSLKRFIELYDVIAAFFKKNKDSKTRDTIRHKRISLALQDKSLLAKALFLENISLILNQFLSLFQTEAPLIHILYDEMESLVKKVMGRFLKRESYQDLSGEKLKSFNVDNAEYWKKTASIEIGLDTLKVVSALPPNDKKTLLLGARSFYLECAKRLLKTLPLENKLLQHLQVLHPSMISKDSSVRSIRYLAGMVPNVIKAENVALLVDEWIRLQAEPFDESWIQPDSSTQETDEEDDIDIPSDSVKKKHTRLDFYWKNIFAIKDNDGNVKYPLLSIVIKAYLSLPHGNADVERGFSQNKRLMQSRSSLNIHSVNGLRQVKSHVEQLGGLEKFKVTVEMLRAARGAYKKYSNRMEEQKKIVIKRKVEAESVTEEMKLKAEEKDIQQKLNASQQMLNNAERNIEEGIKKNAMTLVESGQVLLKEAKSRISLYIKNLEDNRKKQASLPSHSSKKKKK